MNYHKNKNLSPKVQAIKRNQELQDESNKGSIGEGSKMIKRTKIQEIDNLTMRTIGDSLHMNNENIQSLNDLMDFYKAEVRETLDDVSPNDKAYMLLKELESNENFTKTDTIKSRQEFSSIIGDFSKIIKKYIN